jgi:DNA-binding CsgD family transcriptional regulator
MNQSNALSYIRQLCCLGLPSEIAIYEFLKAVQSAIPSENNVFTGLDEQLMPTYSILEHITDEVAELAPFVLPNFFNLGHRKRFREWLKHPLVGNDMSLVQDHFYKTDLYNLLWRKLDQHHCLHTPVFQNGRAVGLLCLYRPRPRQPFNSKEQALCTRLTPYIAHALLCRDKDIHYSDNGSLGMMIMSADGDVVYLSEVAKQLLALTQDPLLPLQSPKQDNNIFPKLKLLCRNLNTIFQGKEAPPPTLCYTNAHGRFMFKAQWLNRLNGESKRLIGITVEHQESVKLKILRGLHNLRLSRAQKEVALLLTEGVTSKDIGERLHIKLTTVKDHIRKIFTKLDIHHRNEIVPKLLALDSSDQIGNDWQYNSRYHH